MDFQTLYKHILDERSFDYKLVDLDTRHVRHRQLMTPNEAAEYNAQLRTVESNSRWLPAN